ncbi:oligoendopeptidase, pepF/M3 family [Clostridium frigidicarnis]|uniref:Oligoendopeptidase, pepF/M3 family n=2 Tax=Clostridium frigidicarnis TaxID=84698 RepID=A0A1I0WT97_9CLOT|nr:oligoendopeptidase, pepF/M3 family [Clostridium frigidicarnis]
MFRLKFKNVLGEERGYIMGLNWSLKELYDSFKCEEFQNDMKKLDDTIKGLKEFIDEATKDHDNEKEKLENMIKKEQDLDCLESKIGGFAFLTISVNSKNEEANKADDLLNLKLSLLAEPQTKMNKWISEIKDIGSIIENSSLLKEHKFYLEEIIESSKHLLSEKEEALLAKMKNSGSNAWVTYKNLLISNHKVDMEIDGEISSTPLTMVLNMAYDSDKEIRKKAYESEIESYKKIEDGVAAALNGIKGEVLTVSETRGYESPLHMTLENSRMDKETLDVMLEAMKEKLPAFRKYLRRKGELLGYKNGLPFYELYAPVIKNEMKFNYEEAKSFVEKNFRTFSDNLGNFARKAFDNNWIDVMPKEGKVGGAFCSSLMGLKESRILLNFGGKFSDVVTMAHELGHGFHSSCLNNESVLNTSYPMPLAETASNFCEAIVKKAAIKNASKEEAFTILETEISDSTQVIIDIYSRYLFESEVFNRRKNGSLSVDEIKEIMLDSQRQAYGDGLDQEYLHPYMWTWKSHYYYADANFYNFPYAFGILFAKGLYAEYLKRGKEFPEQYEELLSVTGKNKIEDVTRIMDIDVHDINFWRNSLKLIEKDIDTFIAFSYEI